MQKAATKTEKDNKRFKSQKPLKNAPAFCNRGTGLFRSGMGVNLLGESLLYVNPANGLKY
ncbi:MAG TPA: hypothetical protein DDW42_01495 [Desulfobacteraceae bacterium]|nr:hypothetical protein [Desulfobacteraceae bacterium]